MSSRQLRARRRRVVAASRLRIEAERGAEGGEGGGGGGARLARRGSGASARRAATRVRAPQMEGGATERRQQARELREQRSPQTERHALGVVVDRRTAAHAHRRQSGVTAAASARPSTRRNAPNAAAHRIVGIVQSGGERAQ